MKKIYALFILVTISCQAQKPGHEDAQVKHDINTMLFDWHNAAATADFDAYFGLMTEDGVFIGTDATENWQNKEFKAFSKPYFDKGKAWSFTMLERNVYIDAETEHTAWFDEHLSTQMGICRGSGVLKKENGQWKVKHYVLSIAVPNENVSELTEMKREWDSLQIIKMRTPY